jgi:general secretion pathway protein K
MSRTALQSGYALIAVLWTAALLSLVAASMIAQSRSAFRIERNEWRRLERATIAEIAINRATLALLARGGGDPALLSGRPIIFEIAGRKVSAAIQDETGKADINEVDRRTLEALLRAAGAPAQRSSDLAAEIVRWREPESGDADEGAAARRFRRFQSIDELLLVPGIDDALFATLRKGVTVYSQTASITPEVAPEFVLRAFLPGETARVEAILAERSLKADVAAAQAGVQTGDLPMLAGRAFMITVTMPDGDRRRVFETVIRIIGDRREPYWVLARTGF